MHIFIETWTPNAEWAALSAAERNAFMEGVGGAMGEMEAAGIRTLGWGTNAADTTMRGDYEFVAVWEAPSQEALKKLEEGVMAAGWYTYFDQVNFRSELRPAPEVIGEHING